MRATVVVRISKKIHDNALRMKDEQGFDYITEKNGITLFRKPKRFNANVAV